MEVTPEHVRWAFRILLDREPDEASTHAPFSDTWQLREHFLNLPEYRMSNQIGHASGRTWVIYETRHNFRIFLTIEDLAIARNIILGRYELSETEFVKNEVRAGDLVVDVGANIGYYTLLFGMLVAPHGRVLAFEPIPFLYDALEKSVRENRLENICELHRLAIGAETGELRLRYADYTVNFGGAFVVSDASASLPGAVDVTAAARRLDDCLEGEERCSFLKIDVEGAEPLVLRGAERLLRRDRPTILCELHNAQLATVCNANASHLIASMAALGYECREISDGVRAATITEYLGDQPLNVVFDPSATRPNV